MNRLFLTKLLLRGDDLKDAILTFTVGFNAITGASDTGKSFAYNAINYALGAGQPPAIPPEAEGYDRVFLELNDGNDQKFTVMRSLFLSEKSRIYIFKSSIDDLKADAYDQYSTGSRAKRRYNDFLMGLFNCPYKTVLISDGEDSVAFTFRLFAHLIMLSETKVYAAHSPIYENDSKSDVARSAALSSFRILLRGEDQPAPPKREKADISEARTIGKKEQLEKLCSEIEEEIIGLKSTLGGWEYEDIEQEIRKIEKKVAEQRADLEHMQGDLKVREQTILELKEKRIRIHDTILRMELLKKNYVSDSERVEFIDEAHALAEQCIDIKCPICGTVLPATSSDKQKTKFEKAMLAEKGKLKKQIVDLAEAIEDFILDEKQLDISISSAEEAASIIQESMKGLLSNGLSEVLRELDEYKKSRDAYVEMLSKEKTLLEYRQTIEDLRGELDNIKKRRSRPKSSKFVSFSYIDELGEFCGYVSSHLLNWGFSDEKVSFNQTEDDLTIGSKAKRSFGQGKRAIINSAFILALLDYSFAKGYAHPGFVMIDSPLTTYRGKDKARDDVTTDVKQSFYNHLSASIQDRQVIIFDNEEPVQKAAGAMYHHFSGNLAIGRAGFIPPKERVARLTDDVEN